MMTLYCWGSTVNGSTGLGDVVDENVMEPLSQPQPNSFMLIYFPIILDCFAAKTRLGLCAYGTVRRQWTNSFNVRCWWQSLWMWLQWFRSARSWTEQKTSTYVTISYVNIKYFRFFSTLHQPFCPDDFALILHAFRILYILLTHQCHIATVRRVQVGSNSSSAHLIFVDYCLQRFRNSAFHFCCCHIQTRALPLKLINVDSLKTTHIIP